MPPICRRVPVLRPRAFFAFAFYVSALATTWSSVAFACPRRSAARAGSPILQPELAFGKYRGHLASELVKKDPGYCRWILKEAQQNERTSKSLAKVAAWLAENAPEVLGAPPKVKAKCNSGC
mmetsp:Transcript_55351/g.103855  ORF Transcript_55351/g.103855 Transcript_55351/m.103855 type:complete len:122 (+) Transcript_55351:43-408(+)